MGIFDSTSKTNVANTTNTTTWQQDKSGNTGFQDIGGGLTLASDDHSVINSLDAGAVAGGVGLGKAALDFGARVNNDSISLLSGLISGALDNSKTLVRDAIAGNQQSTSAAINGFSALAQKATATTDDRVGKVAMYAFAAVAAIFILPALFKGAKGAA